MEDFDSPVQSIILAEEEETEEEQAVKEEEEEVVSEEHNEEENSVEEEFETETDSMNFHKKMMYDKRVKPFVLKITANLPALL